MYIIAGLGNPTREYEKTRHNVGFDTIDVLADRLNTSVDEKKFKGLYGRGIIAGEKVILLKPQTFMNLSGKAVAPAMNWYKIKPQDLIVVHDDMDLPVGMIRIRVKGSSGGHNGIKSIISCINSNEFIHVRIGIGHPLPNWQVNNHVLSKFLPEDQKSIDEAIEKLIREIQIGLWDIYLFWDFDSYQNMQSQRQLANIVQSAVMSQQQIVQNQNSQS